MKEVNDSLNENQEKTTSIKVTLNNSNLSILMTWTSAISFIGLQLSGESCFTHFLNYGGLRKERSTKQATDTFQRRALPRKIMETLKRSIFSFTIANLVNEGILYLFITTDAYLEGRGLYFTFLKIGRKCSDFGKECPGFDHL